MEKEKEIKKTILGKEESEEDEEISKILKEINEQEKIREREKDEIIYEFINNFTDKIDLAERFIKTIPLYYDQSQIWWLWDKVRRMWKIVDEIDILNCLRELSEANVVNSKERNEILFALKQVARKNKPKPTPKTWVQFEKEVVDVMTGERFFATSEYFLTNPIPTRLGKRKETPIIDKIFTEWVGDAKVILLKEIMAYSMLPDYPLNRIFFLFGEGRNGKSSFLRLLIRFLGKENCCSSSLETLATSRFEKARLYKKLVCLMGETNISGVERTDILKKLSGGDLIGFEFKNKTPFDDINYAKLIIATNNIPTTTDKTEGFYRRCTIIDFRNKFEETKDILGDIDEEELQNFALQSIDILYHLLNKRVFSNEGTIEEKMKKYEEKSDPLEKFIKETTQEDPDGYIWKFEFEKRVNEWCRENGFRQFSDVAIGKKMKEKGYLEGKRSYDLIGSFEGITKRYRTWEGIRWKWEKPKEEQKEEVVEVVKV